MGKAIGWQLHSLLIITAEAKECLELCPFVNRLHMGGRGSKWKVCLNVQDIGAEMFSSIYT